MKLSILMPAYNERTVIERCIGQVLAAPLPENLERELIIVDDCSTDGAWPVLERLAAGNPSIRLFRHEVNQGKGAAVRTAIQQASGDFCIIQDADLEYDPNEYSKLLRPLLDGRADAVFGSRYLAGEGTRVLLFWHSMLNKGLTLLSNMFCNLNRVSVTGHAISKLGCSARQCAAGFAEERVGTLDRHASGHHNPCNSSCSRMIFGVRHSSHQIFEVV